jgi:putative ABC transport system substrate-binding protein
MRVVAWPLAARAQHGDQLRRIGVLSSLAETDPEGKYWDTTFRKLLDELGWVDGRNVHIDYRWGAGSQLFAKELGRLLIKIAR